MSLVRQYIWVLVIVGMIFSSLVICVVFLLINRCISKRGKRRILQLHRRSDMTAGSNTYQEKPPNGDTPPLPPRTQFLTAEVLDDVNDYEECAEPDQETELHPPPFYSHPTLKKKPGAVEALSYENLAEEHDYEESADLQPDYIKVEDETEAFPAPPSYSKADPKMISGVVEALSYENLAEEHDYEESADLQPDYIKVEDETEAFPAPPSYSKADRKMISGVVEALSDKNLAEEPDYEQSLDDQPDYVRVEDEEVLLPNPADPADDNDDSEDYDDIDGGDGLETDEDYDDVA